MFAALFTTGFVGALLAQGSRFTGEDAGCNGDFPVQLLLGGKIRGDTVALDEKSRVMMIHKDLKARLEQKMAPALSTAP